MKMPVIGLCHGGNANGVVIDFSKGMIVVSQMSRRLGLQRDDLGKVFIHLHRSVILGDGRLVRDSPLADFMGLAENHQAGSMGPPAEGETSSIEIF